MTELYGAEFEEAKPAVAEYFAQRPYLQQADVSNPNVAFDIVHSAFESVKSEVRREKDRNQWQAIKDAGSKDYRTYKG